MGKGDWIVGIAAIGALCIGGYVLLKQLPSLELPSLFPDISGKMRELTLNIEIAREKAGVLTEQVAAIRPRAWEVHEKLAPIPARLEAITERVTAPVPVKELLYEPRAAQYEWLKAGAAAGELGRREMIIRTRGYEAAKREFGY